MMAPSLQDLIVRRSGLKAELARVEAAIASFADASPVFITTRRNIRNTPWLTTDPARADDCLVVFCDETLTVSANERQQEGFVVRAAWEQFKLLHPDLIGDAVREEK
jgi:hypothetical protein